MKKKIIITVVVLLFVVLGYRTWYVLSQNSETSVPVDTAPTPTPIEELATWEDQSEFTFQYPKSLTVDPHEEDTENYAHVELTSASHGGGIIVWAKDTTSDTIDAWITKEKYEGAIDTTLGEEAAKKVLVMNTGNESPPMIIAAIHNGYLYEIEYRQTDVFADKAYWDSVFERMSTSFAFSDAQKESLDSTQPPAGASTDSTGGEESIEEEEVIE